ncbi:ABC transporter permease [Bacillus sp. DX1.1]|uniref:FtsX-like permease family protein n=1 Tax=unclassified Bacillus (in: firmicutes) TaxID=185979 RepID=UPI002570736C|nr:MULTISPECIES: ABC transporter permease [unclassified Bacillus (in: firmicutes)]MDM5155794.1 ABC transporter permease [Bacillus sp. DX1.1]WJE80093.1 ABC transporter permease [Bacillus sp. DX3.1]
MTFSQLACKNVSQNIRTYAAYFLSSTFSVMIFFLYAYFIYHPDVINGKQIPGAIRQGMFVAEYIIYFFSFFFVFYSVSTFLKMRNKEFGIFVIHGMTNIQMTWMIFVENMLIGVSALISGIGAGILFGKLFFMLASTMMHVKDLPLYLPMQPVKITVISFFILFFLVSFIASFFVKSNKVIALLKGNKKPKPEPKASILLSVLAGSFILLGYGLSVTANPGTVAFLLLPVSVIVIIGTYFLYSQLSVFIIRFLKRFKHIYWKKTNLVSFSMLSYRMKDNARMFFMVTIVSTVSFCAIGTFAAFLGTQKSEMVRNIPFAFNFITYNEHQQQREQYETEIEKAFQKEHIVYEKVVTPVKFQSVENKKELAIILSQANYNKIARKLGFETVSLKEKEAVRVPSFGLEGKMSGNFTDFEMSLQESQQTVHVTRALEQNIFSGGIFSGKIYVVSDEVDELLIGSSKTASYTAYTIQNWEETTKLAEQLEKKMTQEGQYEFTSRVTIHNLAKQVASVILFIGLFIGVIFYLSAVSFLYFRFFTDMEQDQQYYQSLMKLGMNEGEMKRIMTVQMGTLFFIPFVLAALHTSVAYIALQKVFTTPILISSVIVIGAFLLIHTCYFLLLRNRYFKRLKKQIM